jgi:hypothetical protein
VELWNQCAGGRQHIIRSPNFLPLGHWPPATTCPIKPIILFGDARQPVRYRASDAAPRVAGHADRGAHAPRGRQHNSDRPTRWPLRAVLGSRPGPWYLTALPRRRVAMRNCTRPATASQGREPDSPPGLRPSPRPCGNSNSFAQLGKIRPPSITSCTLPVSREMPSKCSLGPDTTIPVLATIYSKRRCVLINAITLRMISRDRSPSF